ncbi:GNAT family N-acetyltransferase [Rhizobiaceae bacterium]|nr:GNAT family N-acetyltransferase [Rhizobiaceae bacterium]
MSELSRFDADQADPVGPLASQSCELAGLGTVTLALYDRFELLEHIWCALSRDGVSSPYQQIEFIRGWMRHVGSAAKVKPRLVLVSRDDRPLALFPLGLRRRGPFRVLGWLADSHTNFSMPLMDRAFADIGETAPLLRAVAKLAGPCDTLELCCLPESWLGQPNPLGVNATQASHNPAFALSLEGGFEAALDRGNGARKRKKFRSQTRKLEDVGGATLVVADDDASADRILDAALVQMAARFDRAGIWNRFNDTGVAAFLRDLTRPEHGSVLRLYGLEIAGELRATFAGMEHQGAFSGCFLSHADDKFAAISPGDMIIHLAIENCCKRGLHTFDLGRGSERYKTSWCDRTVPMFETRIALTRRAHAFAGYELGKIAVKTWLKGSDRRWAFAKRVRARLYGKV